MNKNNNETNRNELVVGFLKEIDLEDKLIGERILASAINKVYQNPDRYRNKITVLLYHELAVEFGINDCSVEKNMRMALEKAWTKGYSELRYQLYGSITSGKTGRPTVAKFILLTVELLKGILE